MLGGRAVTTVHAVGAALVRGIRRAPVATGAVAVVWALRAASGVVSIDLDAPVESMGADAGGWVGDGIAFAVSPFWTPGVAGLWAATVALLTLGVVAERRLGWRRFAAAAGVSLLAGSVTALVLAAVAGRTGQLLAEAASSVVADGGPLLWVVGAFMACTATMATLWRRRSRVAVLAVLSTVVLFDGGTGAVLLLVSAVAGVVFGRRWRPVTATANPVGSIQEARALGALVVAATAVGPVLAALNPAPGGPFATLSSIVAPVRGVSADVVAQVCGEGPTSVACSLARLHQHPGRAMTVMAVLPCLLLLVAATGLRRGRRSAWWAALTLEGVLAAVTVTFYVLTLADAGAVPLAPSVTDEQPLLVTQLVLPSLVPLSVALTVLVWGRGLFTLPDPGVRQLARRLGWWVLAIAVLFVTAGLLVAGQWSPRPDVGSLLADLPLRLVPFELRVGVQPRQVPAGPAARALFGWVGPMFWLGAGVLVALSYRHRGNQQQPDRAQAQRILTATGGGGIAWMGLWDGNRYWFSPDAASYVPYRVRHGIALTTGDPVGPAVAMPAVVTQFARYCEHAGWVPCLYAASDPVRQICLAAGWQSVQIAQETVLDLETLTFTGRRFQDVRSAMNAARREGMRTEWVDYRSAPQAVRQQIRAISEDWVAEQALPEMGFTLGGLEQLDDPAVRCSVVLDPAGQVQAVASWLPLYQGGRLAGWTLDFMRRRPGGFNHSMELLIASSALDLKAQGYRILSLSGTPLTRTTDDTGSAGEVNTAAVTTVDPPMRALDRTLDLLATGLEPVYGFGSLLRFKAKFQPRFDPLFLLYPDPAALPAIARAVTSAYLPDAQLRATLTVLRRAGTSSRRQRPRSAPAGLAPPAPQSPPATPKQAAAPERTGALR